MKTNKKSKIISWPIAVAIFLLAVLSSAISTAQTIVVAPCQDNSRSSICSDANTAIIDALKSKNIEMLDFSKYMEKAKAKGLNKKALKPSGIKKLANSTNIQGLLKSVAIKKHKRYIVSFFLIGANGKMLAKKSFRTKKAKIKTKAIKILARKIAAKLAKLSQPAEEDDAIALAPIIDLAPIAEEESSEQKTTPPQEEPAIVQLDLTSPEIQPEPVAISRPPPQPPPPPQEEEKEEEWKEKLKESLVPQPEEKLTALQPEQEKKVQKTPEPSIEASLTPGIFEDTTPGSIPDISLSIGLSLNNRAGLSPRYATSAFPGLRVDGRVFVSSITKTPILKDIGIKFMINQGIGLKYSSEFRQEKYSASHFEWQTELVYRLAFNRVYLLPACLFRFGYGSAANIINSGQADTLNARYTYTYSALDLHMTLIESFLKTFVSIGYLFDVWPSDRISGNGAGISFGAGVNLLLLGAVQLSIGYEQIQFLFEDPALGKTSDRYQQIYIRAGWSFL
jgi:hypothetical protein